MLAIPYPILVQYTAILKEHQIVGANCAAYQKWLRYYLDYCHKYPVPDAKCERIRLFRDKLREKKQTDQQRQQAAHAVSLYYTLADEVQPDSTGSAENDPLYAVVASDSVDCPRTTLPGNAVGPTPQTTPFRKGSSHYCEAGYQVKSDSPAWDAVIDKMANEVKVRHYSRKTLKTYANWTRCFQHFLKDKPPQELSTVDVKDYLTYLAVKCHVASSTQNQAFNSLLFFFRNGLQREFGELRDVPRAKKSLYIPAVLSREEIDAILVHLYHPYILVAKLLFGCGLRLFEGLKLRVRDFNFDANLLTVHGKGNKARTVPLPESILPELKAQLKNVAKLHERDLAAGYDGVFLDDAIEKKYPKAPKEFIFQWFFPQKPLTFVTETGERRHWHMHESDFGKALYVAVRKAKILKKVTSHIFRHSFATHLLQAGYDIRVIQNLLGHASLKTTMIYTHCVPVRTIKEPKSPLDFQ
jgi:integron integrase